jgi:pseudouridine-5'-phosphate glycosidase
MDRVEDIARAHRMRATLGLPGGQLVANPIPPADELPRAEILPHIEAALAEAAAEGIAAKAVTPFLLQRLYDRTAGRSLTANIALVLSNARLAAGIARALVTAR